MAEPDDLLIHRNSLGSLPEELIREILLILLPQHFQTPYLFPEKYPWNLSAINRKWRTTCLATPEIWTRIVVTYHTCLLRCGICIAEGMIARCALQVDRSRSSPLVVDLMALRMSNKYGRSRKCVLSTLRILASQTERWRTLYIDLDTVPLDSLRLLLREQTRFSSLNTLEVNCHDNIDFVLELPFIPSSLMSLQTLSLFTWNSSSLDNTQFPWNRLTLIHLWDYVGDGLGIAQLLSTCTSLASFIITGTLDNDPDMDHVDELVDNSIVLNQLLHLQSDYSSCDIVFGILPKLNTPNLRSISFGFLNNEAIVNLAALITRSGCKPISLDISYTQGTNAAPLLAVSTTVQVLQLKDCESNECPLADCDEYLALLMYRNGSSTLVPSLRRLKIEDLQLDPALLAQVIRSRNASDASVTISPIERVEITCLADGPDPKYGKHPIAQFYGRILEVCLSEGHTRRVPCEIITDPQ
jgi:hypothetical protein